jgi:phage terminase large subunit-like protein
MRKNQRQKKDLRTLLQDSSANKIRQAINKLSDEEALALLYDWDLWARDNQRIPESDWFVWLILAGRGFGKTRTGAETVKEQVEKGNAKRIALVGPTSADVRDVMIEGESGLMNLFPVSKQPKYEPSKRRVTFANGAIATAYSAEEPNRLRGPQSDFAWADEPCSWKYLDDAWSNLIFGLRLGKTPRVVVTGTPRPFQWLKDLIKSENTYVTRGSTFDNLANLSENFIREIKSKYENTRLGRQELFAEILEDVEGALWKRATIEANRIKVIPTLKRIVIAVDPCLSGLADECGIIVCGVDFNGFGYVLDDKSICASPNEWAKVAVKAYHDWKADCVVIETNLGGDFMRQVLASVDSRIPIKKVSASRGKVTRAEPVASLYEQGKIKHVGYFGKLEDQLCTWTQGESSPDRLDALVYGITELCLEKKGGKVTVF